MSKYDLFCKDNFFVIDKDNLNEVEVRLYGYVIYEDKILINSNDCNWEIPNDAYGCYINVCKNNNSYKIYQDYFGSYGLYLYKSDDYWAISNSFLYLVNYLKTRTDISFNYDFAKTLLAAPTASLAVNNTLINEIQMLHRNCIVSIDLSSRDITFSYVEQEEFKININSFEGIKLIDKWHSKWNNIFKCLMDKNENMLFSLSGGKDSRVSLACLLSPRLDLSRIPFFTAQDTLYTHDDDYKIASLISQRYNFTLNTGIHHDRFLMDAKDNLTSSLLVKCGFHRELMFTRIFNNKPLFRITGSGGDLRDLWNETPKEFIDRNCNATIFNSIDCQSALRMQLEENIKIINSFYPDNQNVSLTANDYFYRYGRQRNHNGKANVESFLGNEIILSPLMDPILYKLNQDIGMENDHDLLYAVIYDRYLKEINDIPFDSNRIVIEPTIKIAKEINEEYPINESKSNDQYDIYYHRIYPEKNIDKITPVEYLENNFYSNEIKQFTYNVLGEEVYNWADRYYKTKAYHGYMSISAIYQLYLVYSAAEQSKETNNWSNIGFPNQCREKPRCYSNNGILKAIFEYLNSLRLELKCFGSVGNEIIIDNCSDLDIFEETPEWFQDNNGSGKVFQSTKGECVIEFHTNSAGCLKIKFKGPYYKCENNDILSIKADVYNVKLTNIETSEVLISKKEIMTVDTNNPKQFEINVTKPTHFKIEFRWYPFVYKEEELNNLYHNMMNRSINFYMFWKGKK